MENLNMGGSWNEDFVNYIRLDLNLCKEVKFQLIFYSYICDKNIDLSNFGVLKFILKDANFSFVFEDCEIICCN